MKDDMYRLGITAILYTQYLLSFLRKQKNVDLHSPLCLCNMYSMTTEGTPVLQYPTSGNECC